eukprot:4267832-Pyramimonas_sp.AAC.1
MALPRARSSRVAGSPASGTMPTGRRGGSATLDTEAPRLARSTARGATASPGTAVAPQVAPRPPALTYPVQRSSVLVRRRPRASPPPSVETKGLSPSVLPWRPLGRVIGRLGAGTAGQFPRDLSDWMNEQYMEGYDHWRGSNMMAA